MVDSANVTPGGDRHPSWAVLARACAPMSVLLAVLAAACLEIGWIELT